MKDSTGFKNAITLAEVLITLIIVGVVAALTFPTLSAKISEAVESRQTSIIEKKLIQGLNQLNIIGNGLNSDYTSTKDFLNNLSKHMKIIQICDTAEIEKCFPYQEVTIDGFDSKPQKIRLSSITTAESMKLDSSKFLPPAAFVMANGTPFIVSYNKICSENPDENLKSISQCVAGLYDYNGANLPNKFGVEFDENGTLLSSLSDLKSFNGANISNCVVKLGEMCFPAQATFAPVLQASECATNKSDYNITSCATWTWPTDPYGGAMKYCAQRNSHLPNKSELEAIAKVLYKTKTGAIPSINANTKTNNLVRNEKLKTALGIINKPSGSGASTDFWLWGSNINSNGTQACGRAFYSNGTIYNCALNRNASSLYPQTLCIGGAAK